MRKWQNSGAEVCSVDLKSHKFCFPSVFIIQIRFLKQIIIQISIMVLMHMQFYLHRLLSCLMYMIYSLNTQIQPALIKSHQFLRQGRHCGVLERLGLSFYHSNSLILFCSPFHVHFSTLNHLLLVLDFKEVIGKILVDFCLRA